MALGCMEFANLLLYLASTIADLAFLNGLCVSVVHGLIHAYTYGLVLDLKGLRQLSIYYDLTVLFVLLYVVIEVCTLYGCLPLGMEVD